MLNSFKVESKDAIQQEVEGNSDRDDKELQNHLETLIADNLPVMDLDGTQGMSAVQLLCSSLMTVADNIINLVDADSDNSPPQSPQVQAETKGSESSHRGTIAENPMLSTSHKPAETAKFS
ncbi:hypothetical protein FS749_010806 [Ceratobasidium sp. UAMH 11750]|nr:hypothetical protein FS749_010806 [Ceratobasidium sp. UAMH 11750]